MDVESKMTTSNGKKWEWKLASESIVPILHSHYYLDSLQCPYCLDVGQYYLKQTSFVGRYCPYCKKVYYGEWNER
jgi:hypothetical protein